MTVHLHNGVEIELLIAHVIQLDGKMFSGHKIFVFTYFNALYVQNYLVELNCP